LSLNYYIGVPFAGAETLHRPTSQLLLDPKLRLHRSTWQITGTAQHCVMLICYEITVLLSGW